MTEPDFEALRAARNTKRREFEAKARAEGWQIGGCALRDDAACYCACGTGGPCEHKWGGPDWESEDGCAVSATCSRCGIVAMFHDMRNGP